ncbi:Arginase/agmatinase/formimionoglutamate hydrolase, arginase family [Hahella chejuensis KCTC 2396]|uniref:Arginase/agmatinase/formimionoglutamate hydrolase, arginase family n=1 Tax=Hahella chejuensis (strain KCTC 2396) TaxID=349521 RepID=Q2SG62_HAHCH|nr:agmatinase family protein [Hahella chejuensis]ABC30362.1 Arginase/agmatinase/formimionoglutamate hydrolase, arginase family [Hahella chejuensis KCTC 2396]
MYERVVNDQSLKWVSEAWVKDVEDAAGGVSGSDLITFMEIPFDFAVSHRPGTRFGPAAILEALNGFSLYCTDKRADLSSLRFRRGAPVPVSNDIHQTYSRIEEAVTSLPPSTMPIFLGGDHSITDPIMRGLLKRSGGQRFGLIVFDAHFDSRPPVKGQEHSGHWMYTVQEVYSHANSVQLGVNAPIYSREYMERAERAGVMVRTPYEIRRDGWLHTLEEAIAHASRNTDGVYVSVDIDCLDRAFAQGTSVPNGCGLMAYEVADALYEIARKTKTIGLDIVEVSPPLDDASNTAEVAAHFVMNYLAGLTERRRD